ncbi:unnamed protein product, partial [Brugia timori]|uniref:Ovule protein n=1 Tax=Brugia timori TaxID=42155 RepID=A0A0R3QBW3_9BILA
RSPPRRERERRRRKTRYGRGTRDGNLSFKKKKSKPYLPVFKMEQKFTDKVLLAILRLSVSQMEGGWSKQYWKYEL